MNTKRFTLVMTGVFALALVIAGVADAQMSAPKTVTISGKLIDLSCSAKGMVKMNSDYNALNNDHKTPDGLKEGCAAMCMKSGQPAAMYSNGKITATLLANASINLYKWAAQDVEIQGFWAGEKDDDVKTFVPQKIRTKGDKDWDEVIIAEMH